jgi:hypothetical protein
MPSCSVWKGRLASSRAPSRSRPTRWIFLGDAANYGISLYAVGQAVHWRSRAALAKAGGMGLIGLWVLGEDLAVAMLMSTRYLTATAQVVRHALDELRSDRVVLQAD